VLRGDHGYISVGARTSVQDGTIVHCTADCPTVIGADCVVGRNAHLEGCVIVPGCLIGSGSVTLNRVVVGRGSIVAAGPRAPCRPVSPRRGITAAACGVSASRGAVSAPGGPAGSG
jgi:carbonic anhydrase/acetyltransferase-like protein (isoleucine patch superfamily)